MAHGGSRTRLCRLLQIPLLLLWASLKQDMHFVKAVHANVTIRPEGGQSQQNNQLETENATNNMNFTFPDFQSFYSYYCSMCWHSFSERMDNISRKQWCNWQYISRPYSNLRDCMEPVADHNNYSYPNEEADYYILLGHKTYFSHCLWQTYELYDPPDNILLTLILIPICLLPFMVALVVWKSKNGELQT